MVSSLSVLRYSITVQPIATCRFQLSVAPDRAMAGISSLESKLEIRLAPASLFGFNTLATAGFALSLRYVFAVTGGE